MRKVIAVIVLTLVASSASGWFGGDNDSWGGWGNTDGYGYSDGRGRGHGRGSTDMDGSFSMTINASGRAHTDMKSDIDGDWRGDYYGDTGWNTHSYPYQYGYYASAPAYNPTAGYEAHRKAVEERRAAAAQKREEARAVTE
ncbi:MAG: sulfur globule family protein [Gammaproteobacteria bacterium]|uniref:Sulfur globule family protein n=1 Tax=Candidatus Thiopontia autotrophica TaxID=2841688 RepID=A0A8J6PEB1_9GAMM|nr:sulfur globule family protein [Candidatus Thiopontia autotrophica]MBL6969590.1 sulfur globule family protein [Gammaproteobacteria bacterium]